jgi:protein tyrosine phosphatase (PTP) superfamily phosphohydrolase (DUF442 family)
MHGVRTFLAVAAGALLLGMAAGCRTSPAGAPRPPSASPAAAEPVSLPGMTNTFRLTDGIWSGSQPEGDAAFATLAAAGIRTVLSVDGTRPDLEAAHRHGLRYVHVPVGYDGVRPDALVLLVRAAREVPGPLYVHCHHGRHRGPTAAALMAMAVAAWSPDRARAWQRLAGTSAAYPGLYRATGSRPPSAPGPDPGAPLPEVASVPDLVARMVEIDGLWDRLGGAVAPADGPAVARLLTESFRELARTVPAPERHPDRYREVLARAERHAAGLEAAWTAGGLSRGNRERILGLLRADCRACHQACRD